MHSLQESLLRQELGDYFSLRLQVYLQVGPSGACLAQPLIQVDAWGGWGSSRCFLPGLWVLPTTQGLNMLFQSCGQTGRLCVIAELMKGILSRM